LPISTLLHVKANTELNGKLNYLAFYPNLIISSTLYLTKLLSFFLDYLTKAQYVVRR